MMMIGQLPYLLCFALIIIDTVCALKCFILFGCMTTEYVHIVDNLNVVNKEASESRV